MLSLCRNSQQRGREGKRRNINACTNMATLTNMTQVTTQPIADINKSSDDLRPKLSQQLTLPHTRLRSTVSRPNKLQSRLRIDRWRKRMQKRMQTSSRISRMTSDTEDITRLCTSTSQYLITLNSSQHRNIQNQLFRTARTGNIATNNCRRELLCLLPQSCIDPIQHFQ